MNIEKNIPAPEHFRSRNGGSIYPFKTMQVGDSVFFEGVRYNSKQMAAAKIYAKRYGVRLIGRTLDDGLRIWRVE